MVWCETETRSGPPSSSCLIRVSVLSVYVLLVEGTIAVKGSENKARGRFHSLGPAISLQWKLGI